MKDGGSRGTGPVPLNYDPTEESMAKRQIYRTTRDKKAGEWKASKNYDVISRHATQAEAWERTKQLAQRHDGPAQAVKHGRDGKIITEHTYPRSSDPRRTKG
jgi:hypothetical protein